MKKTIMVIALILWGVFFYTQLRAGEVSNASAGCFAVGLFAEKVYEYKEQGNSKSDAYDKFLTEGLDKLGTPLRNVQMSTVRWVYDDSFSNKVQAGRFFLELCNEGVFN